ncbi:P-loop containing nucleoside triphosphate hydrolase protein [Aspergillus venezuelensis]
MSSTVSAQSADMRASPLTRPLEERDSLLASDNMDGDRVIAYGASGRGGIAIVLGPLSAMGSGLALPLMNIVFGRLLGDFTQYFIPGSGMTKEEFLATFILTYVSTLCFRFVGLRASGALRLEYTRELFAQPVSRLDEMSPGEVINRIANSSNTIQQSISNRLGALFQAVTLLVTAYAIAFYYSWFLTFVVSSVILFVALCMSITTPILVRLMRDMNEAEDKQLAVATQAFSSIRTVFSLNAQDAMTKRYLHWVEEARETGMRISMVGAVHLGLIFFGVYCSFSLAFYFGLRQLHFGKIDIDRVFMSVLIAVMVMGQIAAPLLDISKAIGSTHSFFDSPQVSSQDEIVFEDVTIAYSSRLSVLKGKTTALIGPSGSGKSTVMALIEGWYQVPKRNREGGIYIGGQNINLIDLVWWRSQIGSVQQEPLLFNDTIYNNICMGLIGCRWGNSANLVKRNLVLAACKEAYAHDFIEGLPERYETIVGEGGNTLSGGQRQRIAVARAIVSKPSVLLLNEANSSIDVHGKRIMQAALDRVGKSRTTIIIAHRLSTIRNADHIIVLDQGENSEEGSHDELIKLGGRYKALVEAQQLSVGFNKVETLGRGSIAEHGGYEGDAESPETLGISSRYKDITDAQKQFRRPGLVSVLAKMFGDDTKVWLLLIVAVAAAVGAAVGFFLQSWLFAKIIDSFRFLGRDLLQAADYWSLIFLILAIGMGLCYVILGFSLNSVSLSVGTRARGEFFSRILRDPVAYFGREENASVILTSRLAVTGSLGIAFIYGWKLTAVGVMSILPVLATATFLRVRYELGLEALNPDVYGESSNFISEAVKAFRTVSALTTEDFIVNRYSQLLEYQQMTATSRLWYSSAIFSFSDSVEFLAMALFFWFGGQLLASSEYSPVDFFVVFIAIIQAAGSAGVLFSLGPDVAKTRAAARQILGAGPDDGDGGPLETVPRTLPTLVNLDLRVDHGQFIGIVGPSGCGKSTLVSLLARSYEPSRGRILLNGQDLREVDIHLYRRQVGLVNQEPTIFEGIFRENLLLGSDISEDEAQGALVDQACPDAEIYDFITSLPDGYSTELGIYAQVSLSGGQKQRLCIARALLRRPSLLILDEATSNLESESEQTIRKSLERLADVGKMSIIAVAHRLSTVRRADCIHVFQDGNRTGEVTIAERGTHEELLELKGQYYRMLGNIWAIRSDNGCSPMSLVRPELCLLTAGASSSSSQVSMPGKSMTVPR